MIQLLKISLIASTLFLSSSSTTVRIISTVFDEESNEGLAGVQLEIFYDDNLYKDFVSDLKGNYEKIDMPANRIYRLYYKKSGYVTKMVEIDSRLDKVKNPADINPVKMQPTLFKAMPGINLEFLDTIPLVKYKFDKNGMLTFNQDYTSKLLMKIDSVRNGY